MINTFRIKSLRNILGIVLLSIMLLKLCALSISHFSLSTDPIAVEKNTEEGKDTKEEAADKNEKKLLSCEFIYLDHGQVIWVNPLPLSMYSYIMQIGSHPLKTVPTPPPDLCA
jgi:hypothetical protein